MAGTEQKRATEEAVVASPSDAPGRPVQTAADGSGPLLQRDYEVRVRGAQCTAEEATHRLRRHFPELAPERLAQFRPERLPLAAGDEMDIRIEGFGWCAVRVGRVGARSLTLQTLEGHLEAGRITFAAQERDGQLSLRIRSRCRLRSAPDWVGYALIGHSAQTKVWTHFLEELSRRCGLGPEGDVTASTQPVREREADRVALPAPTLPAV